MIELEQVIRREVQSKGPITFASFMDLALYYPDLGYYEQPRHVISRNGDFFTSVAVAGLLGELLAFQFSAWLEELDTDSFRWIEGGAHDGRLAADMLTWVRRNRPALFERLEYWIVEPSPRRQRWQHATLDQFAGKVRWFENWQACPADGIPGVIFANELLDAMPVHRFGWDAKQGAWIEWGVGVEGDRLVWVAMPAIGLPESGEESGRLRARERPWAGLTSALPDGYIREFSPAAGRWWQQAAEKLDQGWLMTLDYGLTTEELLAPYRTRGTLRAYQRHCQSGDLLAHPGDQDLTAHVDFSALQAVGEAAGLATQSLISQDRFLMQVAAKILGTRSAVDAWTPERVRQFQTLAHPEHLGGRFRVLVQSARRHSDQERLLDNLTP